MYYVIVPTVVGGAVVLAALLTMPSGSEVQSRESDAQLLQYQAFIKTAQTYFERNAAPAATTAYTWSTLKAAATPAMANATMPPHWKAVRRADGYWVGCTELSEVTAAKVGKVFYDLTDASGNPMAPTRLADTDITTIVGTGGGSEPGVTPNYLVVGQQSADAITSANLCAGT